jgi:hypothetical protein
MQHNNQPSFVSLHPLCLVERFLEIPLSAYFCYCTFLGPQRSEPHFDRHNRHLASVSPPLAVFLEILAGAWQDVDQSFS